MAERSGGYQKCFCMNCQECHSIAEDGIPAPQGFRVSNNNESSHGQPVKRAKFSQNTMDTKGMYDFKLYSSSLSLTCEI